MTTGTGLESRMPIMPYSKDMIAQLLLHRDGTFIDALEDSVRIANMIGYNALDPLQVRMSKIHEAVIEEMRKCYTVPDGDETTFEAYSAMAIARYIEDNRLTFARLAAQNGNLPQRIVMETQSFFIKYFAGQ